MLRLDPERVIEPDQCVAQDGLRVAEGAGLELVTGRFESSNRSSQIGLDLRPSCSERRDSSPQRLGVCLPGRLRQNPSDRDARVFLVTPDAFHGFAHEAHEAFQSVASRRDVAVCQDVVRMAGMQIVHDPLEDGVERPAPHLFEFGHEHVRTRLRLAVEGLLSPLP